MAATSKSQPTAKCGIDDHLNPTLSTNVIVNQIRIAAVDWLKLGIQLGFEYTELETIEREQPDHEQRLIKMIHDWLQRDSKCTWRKLIDALRKIGKNNKLWPNILKEN